MSHSFAPSCTKQWYHAEYMGTHNLRSNWDIVRHCLEMEVDIGFIKEIAYEAGETIKDAISKEKKVSVKYSDADLVTETDISVEAHLRTRIASKFPNHEFLCEESAVKGQRLGNAPTWIIDPIDGTSNFVHSLPFVCVSIGYSVNKEMIHGVVYNPISDSMFYASK
eukprot:Lankesteria_metandrocarpae@DN4249_c0_g1_i2.p1